MMTYKFKLPLWLTLTCLWLATAGANSHFQPQVGDLLFQDANCGALCNAIDEVTYGVGKTQISHVGMVINSKDNQPMVIEANSDGVIETPLAQFLARSLDEDGNPRVIVGRLTAKYQALIPQAIDEAETNLGKPYNASFIHNGGQSFYCSELIYDAFMKVNHNQAIFHESPMDFRNSKTQRIVPAWKEYFKKLGITPPSGKLATNPGQLSREENIRIVYRYGELRNVGN